MIDLHREINQIIKMLRTKDTYEQNDRQMATRSIQYGPRKPQKIYDFYDF